MGLKIKCPFCTLDEDFSKEQLINHLISEGDYAGILLGELVFKIHENLEKLRKQPEPFQYKDVQRMNDKIKLLKSLLEDEK